MKKRSSITLRQRTLPSGRTTLYLDIIYGGRRRTESLKLFLVPETSRTDRQKNRETLRLAETIRAKRIVDAQNREFGLEADSAEETNFYNYFAAVTEKRLTAESRGNWDGWCACLRHMEIYDPDLKRRTFADITREWVQGFRDYLETEARSWNGGYRRDRQGGGRALAENSRANYFNKLKACLNRAVTDGVVSLNPAAGVEPFKEREGTRMYLTVEELKKLAGTECNHEGTKRAFLFSCLTGLRWSDVLRLKWGDVHRQNGFTRIIFTQKKTGGLEYLDISEQAAELMGAHGKPDEVVFTDILSQTCTNETIKKWVKRAGIDKDITFHCARHTFAVMMLDLGTDIYTVSKLLGHRKILTTQRYAKVLDKNKQAAVARIPNII